MNIQRSSKKTHRKLKLYGYVSIISLSLLLLSILFVIELYGPIGFTNQIYVTITIWIVLNMTILPGIGYVQEKLKAFFGKTLKNKCFGYFAYVIFPPLFFNGLLYTFIFEKGLSDFFIFILVPTALMFITSITEKIPKRIRESYWIDALFVLFYFYTFDARLFEDTFNVFGDPSYNILSIYMVSILIYIFIFLRDKKNIGFNLEVQRTDIFSWISNLAIFTIIAIPVALLSGFITPRNNFESPLMFVAYFIGIFLTIGLIEEFAFRGVLLNIIENATGNKTVALIISAIIFGISHYNNATPWDLRYIGLATIAGIFYGLAYLKHKRLLPAVLVHTSVDAIWKYFFY